MYFKVDRIKLHESGAMVAFVDLAVMNGAQQLCVVKGFKVMRDKDDSSRFWLAEPSEKKGDKFYKNFFFGDGTEANAKVMKTEAEEAAISAYKGNVGGAGGGGGEEGFS